MGIQNERVLVRQSNRYQFFVPSYGEDTQIFSLIEFFFQKKKVIIRPKC